MGQFLTTTQPAASSASAEPAQPSARSAVNSSQPESAPSISSAVPTTVEMAFAPFTNLQAAQSYTWQLAHSHYENFSVVSVLLPRHLRQDFCNVYAFCRIADDLSDEIVDRDESLRLLERFRQETQSIY